ncbi:cytochrome P450 [Amycolatopsis taiwanensis]|uniref:Cytochrome P450 n=1 Tax=Amycolatopsis taiwanensis TaxID=342230 RepID=A0A9W6VJT0_9PSEU|nr:cytochrome P450 [Amycolatopsis taiwanensis]GLY69757.1 cytochrome P450 [Amycolatopsis taiwanensis]
MANETAEHPPVPQSLPTMRQCPFDPPAELAPLREQRPISRMIYPDGHHGWLVTGYRQVRAILADRRFSSRRELIRHSPIPMRMSPDELPPPMPGALTQVDPPEHTHYRRLLTGQFTVRRMQQLTPRIEQIVEEHLDALENAGPPADLVPGFALPIPSLVICELLGVPYDDHERFQRDSATMFNLDTPGDKLIEAMNDLTAFLAELVERKRAKPEDDLLSGLITGGVLNDEELLTIAMTLLVAGHETTANMLSLGTYALLEHPGQLAALRDDPALAGNAVEELLRYLSIVHIGPIRAALEDVEIDGVLIKAGEGVTLNLPAANRDPARFGQADELDITRPATGHVSFGHGVHQCLGQQLARIEMRVAYPALLRRFPGLRLADEPDAAVPRPHAAIYGLNRLLVTW